MKKYNQSGANKHAFPAQNLIFIFVLLSVSAIAQNKDPLMAEIITSDLDNFWVAFETSKPVFSSEVIQREYLDKGSKGVKGFTKGRIRSATYLSQVIAAHARYYQSIRPSTERIAGMRDAIQQSLIKLKEFYPQASFPPIYFVMGALSSGGTTSDDGIIIGAEMYGLTPETPMEELNDWLKTVVKPVDEVPHIVAHELIHIQQQYDGGSLLAACIKEGAADFIAELISGKHINQHVHDFANPREKELWLEFKERMNKKEYTGWLYTATEGRPSDLGYWMGYKITKAFYDVTPDKKKAIDDIMNIKNFGKFLEQSQYALKFE